MSIKQLKLREPLLSCYPEYGSLFSIVDTSDFSVARWTLSNFLHFYCREDRFTMYTGHHNLFYFCPYIEYNLIYNLNSSYPSDTDIIDFAIKMINEDYYVVAFLNRYFISNTSGFRKGDLPHRTLISGYDTDSETLFASDNIQNGRYSLANYKFNEVRDAYNFNAFLQIELIKPISKVKNIKSHNKRWHLDEYVIDLNNFANELKAFLNPQWPFLNRNAHAYNLEAIENEIECLADDLNRNVLYVDIRRFYFYFEHSVFFCFCVKFLAENYCIDNSGVLLAEFESLKNDYQIILNLALKLNASKSPKILAKIIDCLNECITKEKVLVQRLIDKLI